MGKDDGARAGAEGRRGRWKVFSMHALSQNPEIISVGCLELTQRWKCELTFSKENRRQTGM